MILDSSSSHSIAKDLPCFQLLENKDTLRDKHVSAPDKQTDAEIKLYPNAKHVGKEENNVSTSWSYLFVHNQKVKSIEATLKKDGQPYFIHKRIKYVARQGQKGMREMTVPSVSGLIFLQGTPKELQNYLNEKVPGYRLCHNCSTGKVAVIPHAQMEPFMRVAEIAPERIRFLLHPFVYYSRNHTLLRIVSGEFAGLEGYVVRIARDRRLVMDVCGMTIAIAGVHAERFEEVGKNEETHHSRATYYRRNLHEQKAFIDRYFHQIKSIDEIAPQTESICLLLQQTLADFNDGKIEWAETYAALHFMIEEIGYYYAPVLERFGENLRPILDAGRQVVRALEQLLSTSIEDEDLLQRCEAQCEELRANYGYLFT